MAKVTWITTRAAGEEIGRSARTIQDYCKEGKIECMRFGRYCTDHQLFFSSLLIACLTVLKSLGFFRFSELIFQFRFSRLNANTRVERRFECFGFVPEKIRTSLSKQILIKTSIARQSGDL